MQLIQGSCSSYVAVFSYCLSKTTNNGHKRNENRCDFRHQLLFRALKTVHITHSQHGLYYFKVQIVSCLNREQDPSRLTATLYKGQRNFSKGRETMTVNGYVHRKSKCEKARNKLLLRPSRVFLCHWLVLVVPPASAVSPHYYAYDVIPSLEHLLYYNRSLEV
jgi:hypothetical protein